MNKADSQLISNFILLLIVLAFYASHSHSSTTKGENPVRPNILFIGIDDLRPELASYGATHIKSPNIDQLAQEGVLFERAYAQWAVCMQSRASMLIGLRPDSMSVIAGFRKAMPDVVTLPQHFKNNGYFTQSFGKIYHGAYKSAYMRNMFQDSQSWSEERWTSSPQQYFSPEGMRVAQEVFQTESPKFLFLWNAKRDPDNPDQWKSFFVRGLATEAPDVPDNILGDGQIADAAIERLRSLATQENAAPFFLAVGFLKPHLPFVAPKKYWDMYDAEKIPKIAFPERPQDAPHYAVYAGPRELNYYLEKPNGFIPPDRARHLRHGYAACVSYIDAQIGRLLGELDKLQLRENTIVVLWSDHGYKLGEFGSWSKHTNFEIDTRVPLIISAPGLPRGERSHALVELVDLHPTLSELAALPVHSGAEGESFASNVYDPTTSGQEAAYSQYPRDSLMGYSVRTADYRYTEWRDTENSNLVIARELYQYDDDNVEKVNVADNPSFAKVQSRLRELLARLQK